MRYIKNYEYFTPIKINNEKPFKIDDNIADKIAYMQDSLKKLRKRVQNEKDRKTQAELNNEINIKVKKLSDLTFKQTKQVAYLKNNPITESSDVEDNIDNIPNLIKVLSSKKFKPEDINKYIGFDEDEAIINSEKNYHYPYEKEFSYDEKGFTLIINIEVLENLLDIENGSISSILQLTRDNNNYEFYVDKEELDYLGNYTKKETNDKIIELSKLFYFDDNIDPTEQGKIADLFKYLDLTDDLETFESEISMAHERAVEIAAKKALEKMPFNINDNTNHDSDTKKYQIELVFEYKTMIKYMIKYKLNVKTIKEFLSNIYDSDDLRYETIEYEDSYSHLNFDNLKNSIDDVVSKYVDSPDDIFPIWIKTDNLEMFKKMEKKYAFYDYDYDIWFKYYRKHINLLEIAKLYNGKILEWFKTYEFQKYLIENDNENYKLIMKSNILNPEIINEYSYIVNVDKFNM